MAYWNLLGFYCWSCPAGGPKSRTDKILGSLLFVGPICGSISWKIWKSFFMQVGLMKSSSSLYVAFIKADGLLFVGFLKPGSRSTEQHRPYLRSFSTGGSCELQQRRSNNNNNKKKTNRAPWNEERPSASQWATWNDRTLNVSVTVILHT